MEVAKSVLLYVEIPGLMSEILRPALHSLARNQGGCGLGGRLEHRQGPCTTQGEQCAATFYFDRYTMGSR